MSLQAKYADLISTAQSNGTANLQVREQDGVLYVDGEAPSEAAKQQLWDIYGQIDPEYRSGDLVMNVGVAAGAQAAAADTYEVKSGDSLSKIGAHFGIKWQDIYEANKAVIGDNPDKIFPGQILTIPK